jgi:hypothetical protein
MRKEFAVFVAELNRGMGRRDCISPRRRISFGTFLV